jgi:hypothetical protein
MSVLAVAVAAACGSRAEPTRAPAAVAAPSGARDFTLWLGGARIGTAHETETWSADGVRLVRTESVRYLRGGATVALATTIAIDADRQLAPSRVEWIERGPTTRRAEAERTPFGWRVRGDATPSDLPAAAIPAELAPLIVRRDGAWHGPLFLPAQGFIGGDGDEAPIAPRRLVARIAFAESAAEATIDLGADGLPVRVVAGDGAIEVRASAEQANAPFVSVDLVAATALPIDGERGRRIELVTDGTIALPTDEPPAPPSADRRREIDRLVARVRARVAPDLGAGPTTASAAATAAAGDCTTFALAYAALAATAGIPTRIATGFRLDDTGAAPRLVRHRWAISWTGHAWIAVDAAFGAAGDLHAVAIGEPTDAGLLAGEAALAHVRGARWR